MIFANSPLARSDTYRRYLENRMRANLGLPGVPIRLVIRGRQPKKMEGSHLVLTRSCRSPWPWYTFCGTGSGHIAVANYYISDDIDIASRRGADRV